MDDVNSNSEVYNKLSQKDKQTIQMYLTARQFKNAIPRDEMIIVPAKKNGVAENTKIDIANLINITAKGEKIVTKIFPFIVNKAFACEVYLKLILQEEKFNMQKMKNKEKHNLYKLYNNTSKYFQDTLMVFFEKVYSDKINRQFVEEEILKISDVFIQWRYIYEKMTEEMIVNYAFLDKFCEYLDAFCKTLIITRYKYNVDLDVR